eukprot:COSAG05_NODE_723_length_7727_cov_19.327871_1_plen_114_part_00
MVEYKFLILEVVCSMLHVDAQPQRRRRSAPPALCYASARGRAVLSDRRIWKTLSLCLSFSTVMWINFGLEAPYAARHHWETSSSRLFKHFRISLFCTAIYHTMLAFESMIYHN